ncbi:hypothetical protein ACQ4WX_26920 [Streptomyces lasalocidi]
MRRYDEDEHKQSHAGNGTVNHGPDEKNAEGLGPDPDGLGAELGGLGDDELALRRMLHSVVDDIEPRSGSLEHLRRAVLRPGGPASGRPSSGWPPRPCSSAPRSRPSCTSRTPAAPSPTRPW